ncbi:MAG TPA: response regulator [Gemmatimonadales bacterium]|nr:response regulator [Gemmatimonadales bacterium]
MSESTTTVLVVEDNPVTREVIRAVLSADGCRVVEAPDGATALAVMGRERPTVVLQDLFLGDVNGLDLVGRLREVPGADGVPIVALTGFLPSEEARALTAGFEAYLIKPVEPVRLREIVRGFAERGRDGRHAEAPLGQAQQAELLQRATVQAAALAVLGGMAEALARRDSFDAIVRDTLHRCIDAAGLSVGVFYVVAEGAAIRVLAAAGIGEESGSGVVSAFGHPELFRRTLETRAPLLIPSGDLPAEVAASFLRGLGLRACLLTPVFHREESLGVLLLASHSRELSSGEWVGFAGAIGGQIGQALALSRAVGEVRASQELLQSVIQGMGDPVFVKGTDSRYLLINQATARLFGVTPEEVVGRGAEALFPADVARFVQESDVRVLREGVSMTFEETLPTQLGPRRFLVSKAPRRDAQGTIIGLVGVARDITDLKRADETIRRLSTAVGQSPAAVIITDPTGSIVYVNRKFTEITGYSSDEVVGKNPRLLKSGLTSGEQYRQLWSTIQSGATWRGEYRNRRKNGELYWASATIAPVKDESGTITNFVAIQEDVTETRSLEAQLRQAQKMEAVGRLAGGVAHDFNNLLTVITSYSQLLLEEMATADPRRADLEEIQRAATGAAALTRQLLAFSRQQVLEPRVLSLNDVVSAAGKMLHRLIGEDVSLQLTLAPDLGNVKADPGQIEQVIMNLAVNARDAMPDGGKLTIETANIDLDASYAAQHGVVAPGPYVLVTVTDTGCGMDEPTKARLFEPFFTTKEIGKGTGLGLATVYGIVKQSNGYIWVYSELGHGTSFKVYLPRVGDVAAASTEARPFFTNGGTETILLAEDASGVRAVAQEILNRLGYTVLVASDGHAALELAAASTDAIHLLVTDVIMPEMSGRQLADRLKHHRPDLKVLFVSGYTDDAIVRHGMLEPGIAFLQKPFTPQALARKVREVLG